VWVASRIMALHGDAGVGVPPVQRGAAGKRRVPEVYLGFGQKHTRNVNISHSIL
jgi:hypothetical protein